MCSFSKLNKDILKMEFNCGSYGTFLTNFEENRDLFIFDEIVKNVKIWLNFVVFGC